MVVLEDLFSAEDFLNKIIPNFWSFLIQLLSLIVLIVVVIFFAYKPVKKMLKARQDHIESEIFDAEKMKADAIIHEREANNHLTVTKKEANDIIALAKENALKEKDLILKQGEEEVIKMKLKAKEDIEKAKRDALEDIKEEMVNISLEASKEILKRNITSEDNARLVRDFIKDEVK